MPNRDEVSRVARDEHFQREDSRSRYQRLRKDFRDPKRRRRKKGRPRPPRGDR